MKLINKKKCLIILFVVLSFGQIIAQEEFKRENLFDFGWRFHYGGAQGAENPAFDDSMWRKIDLPHDWSIEDLPGTDSPFSINAISQVNGGFTTGGTGWYRKTFKLPEDKKDKHFRILFEGAYMNTEVWLNGQKLGNHPYGYSSFWFDITGQLKFGEDNVLCVKVKNEGENSRWYSGSGIYRHVWLQVVSTVHTDIWGTYITIPEVANNETLVNIRTTLVNEGEVNRVVRLITRISDKSLKQVAQAETITTIEPGRSNHVESGGKGH